MTSELVDRMIEMIDGIVGPPDNESIDDRRRRSTLALGTESCEALAPLTPSATGGTGAD
jgi:hypothetical protein